MGSTFDEKVFAGSQALSAGSIGDVESAVALQSGGCFQRLSQKLDSVAGFETRGIERVPDHMRRGLTSTKQYLEPALVWFGINCTTNGLNVGILGPSVFKLGLVGVIM